MSSHHFVKEDQEPALLVLDADALTYEQAGGLLAWVPTLVVDASCLETVLRWGVKIDVALGLEAEQAQLIEQLQEQSPISILSYQRREEATASTIYYLRAKQYKALNIAVNPARLNAAWLRTLSMLAEDLAIVLYAQGYKGSEVLLKPLDKWLPAGSQVKLLATQPNTIVQSGVAELDGPLPPGQWRAHTLSHEVKLSIGPHQQGLWFFEEVFAP